MIPSANSSLVQFQPYSIIAQIYNKSRKYLSMLKIRQFQLNNEKLKVKKSFQCVNPNLNLPILNLVGVFRTFHFTDARLANSRRGYCYILLQVYLFYVLSLFPFLIIIQNNNILFSVICLLFSANQMTEAFSALFNPHLSLLNQILEKFYKFNNFII